MAAITGFSIGRNPYGAFPRDRAFMLAYPAADASCRVDIRPLEPNLDFKPAAGRRRRVKRKFTVHFQASFPVADDPAQTTVRRGQHYTVIITRGILARLKTCGLKLDVKIIGPVFTAELVSKDHAFAQTPRNMLQGELFRHPYPVFE